mgnify:CR=1 FL=1
MVEANRASFSAAERDATNNGNEPIRGSAYYAALLEQQRDELKKQENSRHSFSTQQPNDTTGQHEPSTNTTSAPPIDNDDDVVLSDIDPDPDTERASTDNSDLPDTTTEKAAYFRDKIAAHTAAHDAAENLARYELEITDLRSNNLKLRSELRALKRNSGFVDVFERYDADLAAAQTDLNDLRRRNAKLETQVDSHIVREATGRTRFNSNIKETSISDLSNKLRSRLRNLRAEVLTLRDQLADYQLKDRNYALHKRCWEDAQRKLRKFAKRAERVERENVDVASANAALREEVIQLRARCGGLEQDKREAEFECKKLSLETRRLRQCVANMTDGRNRAANIDTITGAIEGNPYRPTTSFRQVSSLPEEVRACFARLHKAISAKCPRALHTLALLKEHVEKMRSDVRSTILREEQLLDLMIEFVQRGERKNDIHYLLKLREQQLRGK